MIIKRVLLRYDQLLKDRPGLTNTIAGFTLGFIGNQLAEWIMTAEPDPSRTISVSVFQGFYGGNVGRRIYMSYAKFWPKALSTTVFRDGMTKSLFDNFVHVPVLYTPAFYIITAGV